MATKTSHNISGATTNATLVKNAPGVIYGYEIGNNSATADAYVKLYDSATIARRSQPPALEPRCASSMCPRPAA